MGAGCQPLIFLLDGPIHQIVQIWVTKGKGTIAAGSLHPTITNGCMFPDTEQHVTFFRICAFDVNMNKKEFLRGKKLTSRNHWTGNAVGHRK